LERRKPFQEPISRHPQVGDLLLMKIFFGKEKLGALPEKHAVIVSYEYDPPRAGSFDEKRKALQIGFRELRHIGFERQEMTAARHDKQTEAFDLQSVGDEFPKAVLKALIDAMNDYGFRP
jgi:hypothetical protein